MKITNLPKLFNQLQHDNISFLYQGYFTDNITDQIIDISETAVTINTDLQKIRKKLSLLLAECFQNIVRHGDIVHSYETNKPVGIFVTRNIGNSYYISSANLISNAQVPELKCKLESLNQLSMDELKQLYLDVLINNQISKKGGAGLGLIEIARKSGQKLEFDFEEVDDNFSYFYLQVKIKAPISSPYDDFLTLHNAKDFHRIMAEDNIFIIHKGDFSNHTIIPILRMVEENIYFQNQNNKSRKKLFLTLVEILQNISRHGYKENDICDGIFLIGQKDETFEIYAGNFIQNNQIKSLQSYLDRLKFFKKEELNQLYKDTLNKPGILLNGGAGLGLISIFRDSTYLPEYLFTPVDDKKSFFSLGVVL